MPDTFVAYLISRLAVASVEFLLVGALAAAVCAVFPSIAPRWRRVIWLMVLCKPAVTVLTGFLGGALPVPGALTGQMLGDVLFPKASDGLLAAHGTAGSVLHFMAGAWIVVTSALLLRVWLRTVSSTRMIDECMQKGYLLKPGSMKRLDSRLEPPPHLRVIVTPEDCGPATIGVFHPAVIIPDHLLPWINRHRDPVGNERDRLCQILRHELAHVTNRDALYSFAATLLVSLFWFHPIAHIAYRRVRLCNEICCDENVIESGVAPAEYAETLMSIVSGHFARRGFAMSILGDRNPRGVLRCRLQHLLSGYERSAGRRQIASFAAIALLLLTMPKFLADTPAQMIRILTAEGQVMVVRVDDLPEYVGCSVLADGMDAGAVLAARSNPGTQAMAVELTDAAKAIGRLAHMATLGTEKAAADPKTAPEPAGTELLANADESVEQAKEAQAAESQPSKRRPLPITGAVPAGGEPAPILPPPAPHR